MAEGEASADRIDDGTEGSEAHDVRAEGPGGGGAATGSSGEEAPEGTWWEDGTDDEPPASGTVLRVGLVALVVLLVVFALVARSCGSSGGDGTGASGSGDHGSGTQSDQTTQVDSVPPIGGAKEWPKSIAGRPSAFGKRGDSPAEVPGGNAAGAYLWNDFDGWHLWVVNGPGITGLRGSISSNNDLGAVTVARPGSGTVAQNGSVATFALPADPAIVGIDFNPGFYTDRVVFTLETDDGPLAAKFIRVGSHEAPPRMPLVVDKILKR